MTGDLALLAERRAGLAALLGLLVLEEPGPGVADLVRGVPALAVLGGGDPAVAVEYERVFLRGVPLYESGFRSDDGQHGGAALAAVVERYERLGFDEHGRGQWRVAGADHLGLELRCYAMLCREEADAWRSDTADAAMVAVEAERAFLADHLSWWAPAALRAAGRLAGDGAYKPLLEAVDAFLVEEHGRLRPAPDLGAAASMSTAVGPGLPLALGPARLARLLLAPATCGTWLGPADIAAAARPIGVPWRASDTRRALRHVIESAADAGELGPVLGALQPIVAGEQAWHEGRAGTDPGNAAHHAAWAVRAGEMVGLLDQVIAANGLPRRGAPAHESLTVSGADAALLADTLDRVVAELRAGGFDVERDVTSRPGDRAVV